MILDKRKRKRLQKPYCAGIEHVFGDFKIVQERLIKRCKHCPATLTKAEYLKLKINHIPKPEHMVIEDSKEYISLFY